MAANLQRAAAQLATALLITFPVSAIAQVATVSGRILDATSAEPIARATVTIHNLSVISSGDGGFALSGLPIETHIVTVHAFGYDTIQFEIVLRSDTILEVRLAPTPIHLDPIHGAAENAVLRGEVRDSDSNISLPNTAIVADGGRSARSDRLGRFRIELPRGAPTTVSLRAFGYLPLTSALELQRDTAITFALEPDPVVRRVIAHQVRRLEQRATPFRTVGLPALGRDALLASNANLFQMLEERGYTWRVRCVLVDDVQYLGEERAGILRTMLPQDVERVELLYRGRMLRVYTRDFIRRMVMGQASIRPPLYVEQVDPPVCR